MLIFFIKNNTGFIMSNQDVQRLEGDAQSQIILPRVLESLIKHDEDLLIKRANLLNSGKYKGNTK